MTEQYYLLKKIVLALIETIEKESYTNEATLKHNFFHYLKLKNPKHKVIVEENLKNHINFNGRVDYYLDDQTKSYRNDVIIEFKVNCINSNLIKHDLQKLDKIRRLNQLIAPLFINIFSKEVSFKQILKLKNLFFNTNAYVVMTCPRLTEFFIRNELEIIKYPLDNLTFIVNNARFLETHLIPINYDVVRFPNKGGLSKKINLYKQKREQYTKDKFVSYCDPINKEEC